MSGAIKPPGGGPGSIDPSEAAEGLGSTEGALGSEAPVASSEAVAETGTAAWLQRVDAGEISAEQAVDGIVAEALNSRGTQALSPAQRSELEGALRAALLDDPTLRGLLGG